MKAFRAYGKAGKITAPTAREAAQMCGVRRKRSGRILCGALRENIRRGLAAKLEGCHEEDRRGAAGMRVRLNIAWEDGESREYRIYHDGDGRPYRISQLVKSPLARFYWRTMWGGWPGGEAGRVELAKRVLESDQYRREMEERKAAQ